MRKKLLSEHNRLRDELENLKTVMARRIAHDESKFDQKILEKDLDCEKWFKSKKQELKQMQAATYIMKSIFEARRLTLKEYMKQKEDEFVQEKFEWEQDLAKTKIRLRDQEADFQKHLDWQTGEWEKRQQNTEDEKDSVQAENRLLQQHLNLKKEECDELHKEKYEQSQALEQLRNRLLHVERADELLKANSQIEALEAELKRTKRTIHERQQAEADSLRRELMEYVKFIVHILPEELQNKVKEQGIMPGMNLSVLAPPDSRGRPPQRRKQPVQHRVSHAVQSSPYS